MGLVVSNQYIKTLGTLWYSQGESRQKYNIKREMSELDD